MAVICDPNMEMQEIQAVEHALSPQQLDGLDDFDGCEPELRPVAGGFDPLPGPFRRQPGAYPNVRPDAQVAGRLDDEIHLAKPVHHDDRCASQTLREEGGFDIHPVLVAIADDQRVCGIEDGQGDQQLGLAAGLETDSFRGAELHDLFHNVALLVHLDRIDATKPTLVTVLGDGFAEGRTQAMHATGENIGKAHQQWGVQSALIEVLH